MLRKPIIATLSILALLTNALAPAISAASQIVRNRPKKVAIPSPKPMKGVPLMNPNERGGVSKAPNRTNLSKLNSVGKLRVSITDDDVKTWTKIAASPGASRTKSRAFIYLAELQIVKEEPAKASLLLAKAVKFAPKRSSELGLAKFDHALATYLQGRYGAASIEFKHLLKTGFRGVDAKRVSLLARHVSTCYGVHQQHAALGITEKDVIDPLCAVASLGVCLRELHLPYGKAELLRRVRFTGVGSNLSDVIAAAPKLGAAAYAVGTNDKSKLLSLPTPLVAHVEHDHFIAVVKMDKAGVTYNCSDCGTWPGGFKHVTWKQWTAMEADAYAVITKSGSALDAALRNDTWMGSGESAESAGPLGELFASTSPDVALSDSPQAVATAQKAARLIETIAIGQGEIVPGAVECGDKYEVPRCPCPLCVIPCFDSVFGFGGNGDSTAGDPVDVSTGEEEYKPAPDLTVYNPVGPSVNLSRFYDSLRTDGTPFSQGWSHPYNMSFFWDVLTVPGGGGTAPSLGYIFPNGAEVKFTFPGEAGFPTSAQPIQALVVPHGYPLIAILYYINTDGSGNPLYQMTVEYPDHTIYYSQVGNSGGGLSALKNGLGESLSMHYSNYTVGSLTLSIMDGINGDGGGLLTFGVDSNGHYSSATDCYGRKVVYTYDSHANLYQVSEIVPSTASTYPTLYQYTYSQEYNGEMEEYWFLSTISKPSPTGSGMGTTTIAYEAAYGIVASLTDANGNSLVFSDGGVSDSTKLTYYNSESTAEYAFTVYFNNAMSTTGIADSSGNMVYSLVYSDLNDPYRPSSISDGFSSPHTWSLTWDIYGNLVTKTSNKGTVMTNSYDYTDFPLGELASTSTASQSPTYFSYEPSGQIETVTTPVPGTVGGSGTQSTLYTYTSLGNLASVTSPGNNATTSHTTYYNYTSDPAYSYTQSEALGQPITVTDSCSKITHLRWDSQANLTTETDALGNQWQAGTYNLANQVTSVSAPATGNTGTGNAETVPTYLYVGGPVTTETAYDESGTATRTVSYNLGADGETLGVSGDAETTTVTYGSPYWINSITDGNSHTTTCVHGTSTDHLTGDMTQVSYPLASGATDTVNYVYNVMHQPTQRTDGNSVVTNYTYSDGDGLLSNISYPASTSLNVGISYDDYDRTAEVTDSTGSITDSFDDLNEVTQSVRVYTGVSSNTLTYSRYPDGTRSAMTVAGNTLDYYYDADGRYTSMTSPVGTSYASYYDNGWQSSRTLPNGVVTTYNFNAVGALSGMDNTLSTTGDLTHIYGLAYDGVFNLTSVSSEYASIGLVPTYPDASASYSYDSKDRVTADTLYMSTKWSLSNSYGYDGAGNATTFKGATKGYNYDNQKSDSGFSFDGNGNPTSYASTSLTYDPENRLTAYGSTVSNAYRADGLRASKTNSSGTTYFLYDGSEPIVEMNSSGTVTALNIFAPDGLVARQTSSLTTEYAFDQQGNVADRLNTSGAIQTVTQYDAYGGEHVADGTPADPFGYNAQSGYYLDRETGLYLCQHRFYDPSNGRWLNRDPIGYGGGTNLYGYCAGGPVGWADEDGLRPHGVSAATARLGRGVAEEDGEYESSGEVWSNGLATGWHAAGHPFGFNDDGSFDNMPGYGTAKALSGVGYLAAGAAAVLEVGGVMLVRVALVAPAGMTVVSRWGDPELEDGDWVMNGPANWSNYIRSGKWDPFPWNQFAPPGDCTEYAVPPNSLSAPPGWEAWKWILGQRIYNGK